MTHENFQKTAQALLRLSLPAVLLPYLLSGIFAAENDEPAAESAETPNPSILALDILALNQKSTGITLPDFDKEGRPSGQITAESATRTSADILTLEKMQILMRDEMGNITIDLPEATFNLATSMLVGTRDVVIQRRDFILTGDRLEFNTKTRDSVLLGNIKMRIYNQETIQKQEMPSNGE
jgi:hypothetical protein